MRKQPVDFVEERNANQGNQQHQACRAKKNHEWIDKSVPMLSLIA